MLLSIGFNMPIINPLMKFVIPADIRNVINKLSTSCFTNTHCLKFEAFIIFKKFLKNKNKMKFLNVVAIVTQGFGNRIRAVASACVLAKLRGCTATIIWNPADECNIRFSDVFMSSAMVNVIEGQEGINHIENVKKRGLYYYNPTVHTNVVLTSSDDTVDTLIVCGGHEYKDPNMSETVFIAAKNAVYTSLCPTNEIETLIRHWETRNDVCIKNLVGVHLRVYVDRFDRADIYDFQKDTSVADTLATLATIRQRSLDSLNVPMFFLACNHLESISIMKSSFNELLTYDGALQCETSDRSNVESMKQSIIEFILLSRCRFIVGTYNSSFSDEAAIFGSISMKICANINPSLMPYHIYGHSIQMGRNVVCPNLTQMRTFIQFYPETKIETGN
jgi:hypothetical protein